MKLKLYFYTILIFFSFACKSDIELSMERGIQFYEWNKIEKAIFEFKYIIHTLSNQSNNINYENIKLLSRAHHNLAIAYAKKSWYDDAIVEANISFDLIPSDDNKKLINLINKKILNKKNKK